MPQIIQNTQSVHEDSIVARANNVRPGVPRVRVRFTPRVKTAMPGKPTLYKEGATYEEMFYTDEWDAIQRKTETRTGMALIDQAKDDFESRRRAYAQGDRKEPLPDNLAEWDDRALRLYHSWSGVEGDASRGGSWEACFIEASKYVLGEKRGPRPLIEAVKIDDLPPLDEAEMARQVKVNSARDTELADAIGRAMAKALDSHTAPKSKPARE